MVVLLRILIIHIFLKLVTFIITTEVCLSGSFHIYFD